MSDERYPRVLRVLHWSMAFGIALQFAAGWLAEHAASGRIQARLMDVHIQLGVILLALLAARIACRMWLGAPPPSSDEPAWRRRAAHAVHAGLYACLLLLPLSGYVIQAWMGASVWLLGWIEVPRLFTPPADDESLRALSWYAHVWGGWLLGALIAVHVGAALWHQWIRRDDLVRRRML